MFARNSVNKLVGRLRRLSLMVVVVCMTFPGSSVRADMLGECLALSNVPSDIHNCMDNFLDHLDRSMSELESFIEIELGGSNGTGTPSAEAFARAQAAFRDFRRENCLWYLEISTPRSEAEQIAKNCLAEMSQARLKELQALIADDEAEPQVRGYYIYGADTNTLLVCGSRRRLWVEGESELVAELQQTYANSATADKAMMYVVVTGRLSEESGQTYPEHDGVFRISSMIEMRPPKEGDCQLPSERQAGQSEITSELAAEVPTEEDDTLFDGSQLDPEQQLNAYFGAWLAACTQLGDSYGCVLSVKLEGGGEPEGQEPVLKLTRRSKKRTIVDLEFPGQEIDSTERILWSIDKFDLGILDPSRIRVDETAARQQVRDRSYIQNDLLPPMLGGVDLFVTVNREDNTVSEYKATLRGLTRAIEFADDFTKSDGKI